MGLKKLLGKMGCMKVKAGIILLGLSNSGKTTIVHVLTHEPLDNVVPTVGFSVEKFSMNRVCFTTYDMSGASKYQSLWVHYYSEAEAIVFVVDASDSAHFQDAKAALDMVLSHPKLQGRPLLVLANKQDKPNSASPADVASQLGLSALRDREFTIRGCSALHGQGVLEGLSWLMHRLDV